MPANSPADSPAVKHAGLALVFVATLGAVQGSDPNIASTALVGATRGLGITNTSLAASISTLSLAATAITLGLVADTLGRRRVMQVSLLVSAIGDLMVFLAPDPTIYMIGRAVAGIGLGGVYGTAFAYVRTLAKPGRLSATMGLFTSILMVGTVILTFIGGALSQLDWRTAYLLVPALCILSFFVAPMLLPKEPRISLPGRDIVGQLLLAVGIVALLGGIGNLGKSLTSPVALGGIAIGLVLLAAWVIWEARNPKRFFPVALFKNPIFLAAITAGFIYNFGNSIVFLQATNLWQYVVGLKTLEVSMWQLPMLLAGVLSGLVVGRAMTKGMRPGVVLVLGGSVTAIGMILLGLVHSSTSFLAFLPGLILAGAGVIIGAVPYGSLILREAPAQYFGPVASSRLTFGQFFYAMGFAASTIVIDRLTIGGTVGKLEAAGVPATQVGTGLDAVTAYAAQSTTPTTSLGKEALSDAVGSYGSAFATMMYVTAALVFLAGIVGLLLLRKATSTPDEETPESVKHPAPSTASG